MEDPGATVERIVEFIRSQVEGAGANGVVVGMSGGLDSSVVACLCARALGRERVLGLSMPDENTPEREIEDAREVATKLGIGFKVISIEPIVRSFSATIPDFDPGAKVAGGNLRARVRMCILYYYANVNGYLVAGTSNRSELRMGYFTKYGDGGADFLPLGSLYKTQVRELARYLGIPQRIIEKPPSAGLWVGQTDEGELGITYEKLDKILMALDRGKREDEIVRELGVEPAEVRKVLERERLSRHKLRTPPVP